MPRYASSTTTSPERSQQEIQATLRRYGADGFMIGFQGAVGLVGFTYEGIPVQLKIDLPRLEDFMETETGRQRTDDKAERAREQAERQVWRIALLMIKAKLEAVDQGLSTVEKEFMADVLLPDGQTIGEKLVPKLKQVASDGKLPRLLPGSS